MKRLLFLILGLISISCSGVLSTKELSPFAVVITASEADVKKEPYSFAGKITSLTNGDTVTVIGEEMFYYKVIYGGTSTGFVKKEEVTKLEQFANAKNIRSSQAPPISKEPTVTQQQTRVLDSTQIAYGNIYFGEDQTTVLRKMESSFQNIGKYQYVFGFEYVDYDSKTAYNLYRVSFESYQTETANYFETYIKDFWQNLVDVISTRYGKREGAYPNFLDVKSGFLYPTHSWHVGTKDITIGVKCVDSRYRAVLWITDSTREKLLRERKEKEAEEKKKSDAKKF